MFYFSFFVFSAFLVPLLLFIFQAVDCLLSRTCVSDVVGKGIGAPTVQLRFGGGYKFGTGFRTQAMQVRTMM